jgi:uncharacterized membrane protein YraQ (UPF0718 family)
MIARAQMVLRHREGLTAVVLLVVLLAGLIAYKTGPALTAIHAAQATGGLTLRPYLANSPAGATPLIVSNSVLHVGARTLPLILAGIPVAILMFNYLRRVPSFAVSNSFGLLILFIGTVLLLPLPTLFEIPLAYSLPLIGAPLGMVAAVLFAGAAINLPSLLIVGRTAGIKASLLLAVLVGGLATGTALAFLR